MPTDIKISDSWRRLIEQLECLRCRTDTLELNLIQNHLGVLRRANCQAWVRYEDGILAQMNFFERLFHQALDFNANRNRL